MIRTDTHKHSNISNTAAECRECRGGLPLSHWSSTGLVFHGGFRFARFPTTLGMAIACASRRYSAGWCEGNVHSSKHTGFVFLSMISSWFEYEMFDNLNLQWFIYIYLYLYDLCIFVSQKWWWSRGALPRIRWLRWCPGVPSHFGAGRPVVPAEILVASGGTRRHDVGHDVGHLGPAAVVFGSNCGGFSMVFFLETEKSVVFFHDFNGCRWTQEEWRKRPAWWASSFCSRSVASDVSPVSPVSPVACLIDHDGWADRTRVWHRQWWQCFVELLVCWKASRPDESLGFSKQGITPGKCWGAFEVQIYVKLLYTCLVYNMHIFVYHYNCRHNNNYIYYIHNTWVCAHESIVFLICWFDVYFNQIHDVPLCFGEGLEPSKAFFKRHLRAVGHSWHIVFWKTSQVPFGPGWPGPVAWDNVGFTMSNRYKNGDLTSENPWPATFWWLYQLKNFQDYCILL